MNPHRDHIDLARYAASVPYQSIDLRRPVPVELAARELEHLVDAVRRSGINGPGVGIGEDPDFPGPEAILVSPGRIAVLLSLVIELGGYERLQSVLQDATPTEAEVERTARELGISLVGS